MKWVAGGATALVGLAVLISGLLLPPHIMETGQIDPKAWALPMACGAVLLSAVLRRSFGKWRTAAMIPAMLALAVPPLVLCVAGSAGQVGRLSAWLGRIDGFPAARTRPVLGILSGPMAHEPVRGSAIGGFAVSPLWEILGRRFQVRPLAAVDRVRLDDLASLLVIQPRALVPEELVAVDRWVRQGGRAVLLVDPDLRWADARPLGHPLRAPPISLLGPLLDHWGLTLAPAPARSTADPVQRRFVEDGRMIQTASASHFIPGQAAHCTLSSGGLVARCMVGRGSAVLVADADFANDALWTMDPQSPGRTTAWTSDAIPLLAQWLAPDRSPPVGRRIWLVHAEGLPVAVRAGLAALMLCVLLGVFVITSGRTKRE